MRYAVARGTVGSGGWYRHISGSGTVLYVHVMFVTFPRNVSSHIQLFIIFINEDNNLPLKRVGNIKTGLKEIEWEMVDWFRLAQDTGLWRAVVNTVMNLRLP